MTKLINIETDVVIVGAGLVGLSAAVAFAKQGKRVVLLDSKPSNSGKPSNTGKPSTQQKTADWDARIYAISPESEAWLTSLGVWNHVDNSRVCPIDAMHLWHNTEELILKSDDAHLPKLGVIMESQNLMYALWQTIKTLDITLLKALNCAKLEQAPQHVTLHLDNQQHIQAKLLIAADGVHSWVRQQMKISVQTKAYHQTAIVANFQTEFTHQNVAMQWFAPHETLALLPLVGQKVSLVWSLSTEKATKLLSLSDAEFTAQLEARVLSKLGHLSLLGGLHAFNLYQQTASAIALNRVALVGDAAHQIHPMAGQGVNLGFRDVMELSYQATKLHALQTLCDEAQLRHYARARKADILSMTTLTSGLDDWFSRDAALAQKMTQWGMRLLNQQAMLKKRLIQQVAA